jgi:hypothetical protein
LRPRRCVVLKHGLTIKANGRVKRNFLHGTVRGRHTMADLESQAEKLEQQRMHLLGEKKLLAQLEREAFAEHKKLEEEQLA